MAVMFAFHTNRPVPKREVPLVRDVEWFKHELRKVGVSPMHIVWHAETQFCEVHPLCLDRYIQHRRHHFHQDALALAHSCQ